MMKQVIVCDVQNNTKTTEWIEDNTPAYIDYQSEIQDYKRRLAQTDYVVIKIAEGAATRDEYEDVIDERVRLRNYINELEELDKKQQEVFNQLNLEESNYANSI